MQKYPDRGKIFFVDLGENDDGVNECANETNFESEGRGRNVFYAIKSDEMMTKQ